MKLNEFITTYNYDYINLIIEDGEKILILNHKFKDEIKYDEKYIEITKKNIKNWEAYSQITYHIELE